MPGRRAVPLSPQRSRHDRLYPPRRLGPREQEAAELVRRRPGLTIAELARALGDSYGRAWQIVKRQDRGRIERKPRP